MMKLTTYIVPTCEFLSSFEFDENDGMLNFRLGNQDHTISSLNLIMLFISPKTKMQVLILIDMNFGVRLLVKGTFSINRG